MKVSDLALFGGEKLIKRSFKKYNPIGEEEVAAAKSVVKSGVLSEFIGAWEEGFLGGPKVRQFERDCEKYFGVKHAITVNSWTSGLVAAVGSIQIEPGDEVIVTPWTMSASATAIVHWNAIPVFADIDPRTFNLDAQSVIDNITSRTRAIMAVDIFGQSADIDELKSICEEYDLKLIIDSAQSPGAIYRGKFAGTQGDVGGFSLNYHKHIHTGEGGVVVTDNDLIAERVKLIRNHAEAVVPGKGETDLCNMIGHNFRLGEIECAIGIEQLKKLDHLVLSRQRAAQRLSDGLKDLEGLKIPHVRKDYTHVYYVYGLVIETHKLNVSRDLIYKALMAEGIEGLMPGYANIHLLPMYQNKQAYGSSGFPWSSEVNSREINYKKGICPIAEKLQDETFLGIEMCLHDLDNKDVDQIIAVFEKVWLNLSDLRS
ncbi:DegT/DnrJ/EryC1/StrS family aminotransferase [Gammaproteobacteria bacterium]|nr:DegT/DnrJ/EryC1/StrS family aminotransferase [Gammaproteobacteria bacterium]